MKRLLFKLIVLGSPLVLAAGRLQAESREVAQGESDVVPSAIQVTVPQQGVNAPSSAEKPREVTINFNNVSVIEYIRFLSKLSNKNFLFDETELQFNVTIVSEQPTSVENLMAALLQELTIHNLSLLEKGNTIIIHQNPKIKSPGRIVSEGMESQSKESEIITGVFRLNTLDPNKAGDVIRPLLSNDALVEVLQNTNTIIITDLASNVNKVGQLLRSLDSPNSGMQIGHYIVKSGIAESIATLAEQLIQPIAQGNPFVLIPQSATNSIFVVSNPFIVEKAIAILQYLDSNDNKTQILTLERLKLQSEEAARLQRQGGAGGSAGGGAGATSGQGSSSSIYRPGEELTPGEISPSARAVRDLPAGHLERTLFYIYKLKYRKGDQIQISLRKIADSLQSSGSTNSEIISVINSAQWIESTNSLIFTGTSDALDRIKELVEEIDTPLRQVFIEMLILDCSLADSLEYGVDWGARFNNGDFTGSEAFLNPTSLLPGSFDTADPTIIPSASNLINNLTPIAGVASPAGLARAEGFNLGLIGRHLTHNGVQFGSIAALVHALHSDIRTNIIMNPKIITEDNNPAELFVGELTRYKTQSIANDLGNVITNNFQFLDVGTTLKVTPLIGNNGIITLEISQEISRISPEANIPVNNNDVNLVPVTEKNKTITKVHVPDKYFVVMSGMLTDTEIRSVRQIPCLGGIPLLGGAAKQKANNDRKRNLMIFMRPEIVDSEEQLTNLTRRQQNLYNDRNKFKRGWNYEIDEALDYFNLEKNEQDWIDTECPH